MMPGMDGWEVYQHLKADDNTKTIPVIIITAKAQAIDRVLGLHIAKVDDYISKPFRPQELLDSIEQVLTRTKQQKILTGGSHPVNEIAFNFTIRLIRSGSHSKLPGVIRLPGGCAG